MKRIIFIIIILSPLIVYGATSIDFSLKQEETGVSTFSASSSDYKFNATIGEAFTGVATSTDYTLRQGTTWISSPTVVLVSVLFSTPQLRDVSGGDNYDSTYYLTVRTSSNSDDIILYSTALASSTVAGASIGSIELVGVSEGIYDIGIKTNQTLTKVLQDVPLVFGNTVLNFSATDYASTTRGTEVLLSGDVDGTGVDNTTLGDDLVNSVDLSVILADLNDEDSDGNQVRSNINQDLSVNSVDLSIFLSNLNAEGDN